MRTINGVELDDFTQHYLVAALWSSTDNSNEQGGEPLDANYDLSDLSVAALQSAKEDCECFQKDNATWLDHAGTTEQNGHDFWLTRNQHGAGYWDRCGVCVGLCRLVCW